MTVTGVNMKGQNTWERRILRIYIPVVEQGMWRIRTNQELWEIYIKIKM
jgi:hypothetical protein